MITDFEQSVEQLSDIILKQAEKTYDARSPESWSNYSKKFRAWLHDGCVDYQACIQAGYNTLLSALEKMGEDVSKYVLNKQRMHVFQDSAKVFQSYAEGKMLQELLGYSDDQMCVCYNIACQFYDNKNFENAGNIYLFLTHLNPIIIPFWMGVGCVFEATHRINEAIAIYGIVIALGPMQIENWYHPFRCALQAKHYQEVSGLIAFAQQVCQQLKGNPEFSAFCTELDQLSQHAAKKLTKSVK